MTLFLTGGTGFVGSHCARIFLAHGWRVRALVRRPERVGLLPRGVDVVQGDLGEPASYHGSLRGCAAIVHCAASTSARHLAEFRRINIDKAREIRQADWFCDGEPLFRDLGITTAIRWREGLRDTCRWYVDARWLTPRAFAGV